MFGKRSTSAGAPASPRPAAPPPSAPPRTATPSSSPQPTSRTATPAPPAQVEKVTNDKPRGNGQLPPNEERKPIEQVRSEQYYDVKTTVFNALIDTIDLTQLAKLDPDAAREESATLSVKSSPSRMS